MFNVVFCDDEQLWLDRSAERVTELAAAIDADIEVHKFRSPARLISALGTGLKADILFLDIMMGAENGLDTARQVRAIDPDALLILLTSYADFARQGYEVKAFRYIMKNEPGSLARAFSDACSELVSVPMFTFKRGTEICRVPVREISYIESDKRQLVLHSRRGEYRFYARLDDIKSLPDLIRIHRSYLVAPASIEQFSGSEVILSDGTHLPVSDTCRAEAKRRFMLYM